MRGYSSECEACWADVADSESESTQQNDLPAQWQSGAGRFDKRPVIVQQRDVDICDVSQHLIDVDGEFVVSASSDNHIICDSVKPTVLEDAPLLNGDESDSGNPK